MHTYVRLGTMGGASNDSRYCMGDDAGEGFAFRNLRLLLWIRGAGMYEHCIFFAYSIK